MASCGQADEMERNKFSLFSIMDSSLSSYNNFNLTGHKMRLAFYICKAEERNLQFHRVINENIILQIYCRIYTEFSF